MACLAPVDHGYRKPEKLSKQVNKFDILIDQNTKISRLFEIFFSKIGIFEEFITSDKVVTLEKIPSNTQKRHLIIQAYNEKNKNLMLMQLSTKLLYDILEAGNYCFAIYYPHYKEKLGIIEFAHNFSLYYSNELIDNPTRTFSCTT